MKRTNLYFLAACVLLLVVVGVYKYAADRSCAVKKAAAVPAEVVKPAAPAPEVLPEKAAVVEAVAAAPAPVAAEAAPAAPAATVAPAVLSYNFGDHRSSTLTTKAWQELAAGNKEGVVVYTNRCIEMYGAEAAKMQAGLQAYPSGDPQSIFSYWAVNDVATSLYIQGEAYRKGKEFDKARAAYERVIKEFAYGQAYDPASRTFWKPAEAAEDALYMIDKGLDLDYGNMTSNTLVQKMWTALEKNELEAIIAYNMKLERLYGGVAKDMQRTLKEFPYENIHTFWALNDVGTGLFILGEAYRMAGKNDQAAAAYKKLAADYAYSQCWDPAGWFWKPAEAAQQKLIELEAQK